MYSKSKSNVSGLFLIVLFTKLFFPISNIDNALEFNFVMKNNSLFVFKCRAINFIILSLKNIFRQQSAPTITFALKCICLSLSLE